MGVLYVLENFFKTAEESGLNALQLVLVVTALALSVVMIVRLCNAS